MFMVMFHTIEVYSFTELDHFMAYCPLICAKNKSCFTAHIYYVLCPFLIWKPGTGLARKNLLDICALMRAVSLSRTIPPIVFLLVKIVCPAYYIKGILNTDKGLTKHGIKTANICIIKFTLAMPWIYLSSTSFYTVYC